jgi:hypothetical protein
MSSASNTKMNWVQFGSLRALCNLYFHLWAAIAYAQFGRASHGALHCFSFVRSLIYVTFAVAIDAGGMHYLPDIARIIVDGFLMGEALGNQE